MPTRLACYHRCNSDPGGRLKSDPPCRPAFRQSEGTGWLARRRHWRSGYCIGMARGYARSRQSLRRKWVPPMHYLDKAARFESWGKRGGLGFNRRQPPKWVRIQPALTSYSECMPHTTSTTHSITRTATGRCRELSLHDPVPPEPAPRALHRLRSQAQRAAKRHVSPSERTGGSVMPTPCWGLDED